MMRLRALFTASVWTAGVAGCNSSRGAVEGWGLGEVQQTVTPSAAVAGTTERAGGRVDFRVFVPTGIERFRPTLAAQGSIVLGARAAIVERDSDTASTVTAMGPVTVGEQARVGSIDCTSEEGVVLKDGVAAAGFVRTAGPVRQVGQPAIAVGVMEHAQGGAEYFEWSVSFGGMSGGDQTSGNSTIFELRPGTYGKVVVEAGSIAVLRAGQYFLDSLEIREKGVLENDNSKGAIYVWIRSALSLEGSIIQDSPGASVLFGYAGTTPPHLSMPFLGTLVAPATKIELPHTQQPHVGSFFASSIQVADDAVVQHAPFSPWFAAETDFLFGQLPDWLAP